MRYHITYNDKHRSVPLRRLISMEVIIMSERLYGFIGTGNMGGALATAAARAIPGDRILLSNRT